MMSGVYQTNIPRFLQCQLTETTDLGQICCSTRTHYLDSKPNSLYSYSLMLSAYRRSNKFQFYSLWFDYYRYLLQWCLLIGNLNSCAPLINPLPQKTTPLIWPYFRSSTTTKLSPSTEATPLIRPLSCCRLCGLVRRELNSYFSEEEIIMQHCSNK